MSSKEMLINDFVLGKDKVVVFRTHPCKAGNLNFFSDFFFFWLFRATPVVYGSSQAMGQIGAATASLNHIHGNSGSKTCL